jgi:hypothetical protein
MLTFFRTNQKRIFFNEVQKQEALLDDQKKFKIPPTEQSKK